MKADVLPPAAPPELNVPSWLPEPIARCVRAKYAAGVHGIYAAAVRESGIERDDDVANALAEADEVRDAFADVVREELADLGEHYRPLVCDHRMRGVWRELSRQRNGAFLHPAHTLSAANAKERQEMALVELFETALACQQTRHGATMTARQVEEQRRRYLAKARELQSDAVTMIAAPRRFLGGGGGTRKQDERYRRLLDAADVYKEYAAERYWADSLMSLERRHDGRARWVALTIGEKFRALFGSPMYGLTATITSVVLGRKVAPRTVRQWCHPAHKARKKSA
jgi:hypothetical protein